MDKPIRTHTHTHTCTQMYYNQIPPLSFNSGPDSLRFMARRATNAVMSPYRVYIRVVGSIHFFVAFWFFLCKWNSVVFWFLETRNGNNKCHPIPFHFILYTKIKSRNENFCFVLHAIPQPVSKYCIETQWNSYCIVLKLYLLITYCQFTIVNWLHLFETNFSNIIEYSILF